jgi:hypothetical protein
LPEKEAGEVGDGEVQPGPSNSLEAGLPDVLVIAVKRCGS